MSGWLIDTNVLSELRRPKPSEPVRAFMAGQPLASLHVSIVTFAEIRFGIERVAKIERRAALSDWLERTLRPMFVGRKLPISEDVMVRWRLLVEIGRKANHTFSQPDLIIAATAAQHGLTIVTRDTGDFRRTGVRLLDPWKQSAAES